MSALRLLNFGGGVQTTALCVLLVRGEFEVDHIVMADTGGERPDTYEHVEVMQRFLAQHGRKVEIVTHGSGGLTLEEYVRQRSNVLPTHTPSGGLGHRQCTAQFKLRPVKAFARAQGAKALTNLIGISTDEIHRAKDAREKWVTNEYPLIERNLSRDDCLRIVQEAGLPRPPKSSCYFCPLQRRSQWQHLAATFPVLFEQAVDLERHIEAKGGGHLASERYPLTAVASVDQLTLGEDFDREAEECEGGCFL